jgi:sugar (pentulose or hexulose) kinase
MRARAIGIDVGTSGVRAAALADDCGIQGSASVAMSAFGDATAPATWWDCVRAVISELGSSCDLSHVRALAVDGTSGTMLAVDQLGEPIGPARMYDEPCNDETIIRTIAEHAPAESAARGATSALARVLMMQGRPGVRHMLHQADWISGKLSGRFDRSDWNNALKTGYDPVAGRWPDWIERTGADLGKLPVVLKPGAAIGQISAEAVGLRIPESAIVHAGTTDGCASFLATGASEAGDGVTALGSTLVVKLLCDYPIFAPEFGIYSHRIGSNWLAGGASNAGGKVIEQFFPRVRLAELSAGLNPDKPTGLDYYPLLKAGERFPINDPKLPPRLEPRPKDDMTFLQAILEGVADIEALAYRKLAELGAPPLRSVRTVGGGAANSAWTKIRERKLGAPFKPADLQEACAGAARLALQSLRGFG